MDISKKFLGVCKKFNEYGVKYIVCGAYACKLHGIEKISGQKRLTNDYDFIIDTSNENIKKIKKALADTTVKIKELKGDDLKRYQTVKIVGKEEIDLISSLWRIDYKTASKNITNKRVKNIEIPVISVDNLIETKKHSFRGRDKADVYWLNKMIKRKL